MKSIVRKVEQPKLFIFWIQFWLQWWFQLYALYSFSGIYQTLTTFRTIKTWAYDVGCATNTGKSTSLSITDKALNYKLDQIHVTPIIHLVRARCLCYQCLHLFLLLDPPLPSLVGSIIFCFSFSISSLTLPSSQ